MNTMVATTVPTIHKGKLNICTAGGGNFFTTPKQFILQFFTFGNLRIHPHSGGDSGGESLEKNGGVHLTVRGTFLETKTEGSPPQ